MAIKKIKCTLYGLNSKVRIVAAPEEFLDAEKARLCIRGVESDDHLQTRLGKKFNVNPDWNSEP